MTYIHRKPALPPILFFIPIHTSAKYGSSSQEESKRLGAEGGPLRKRTREGGITLPLGDSPLSFSYNHVSSPPVTYVPLFLLSHSFATRLS
jgi:hypothetical protein